MNNRRVLSIENLAPPSVQDTESPVGFNAAGANGPSSLGFSTPQKRKRSDKEEADSPGHHFSRPGSASMIINGQPYFAAQAPAPARVPSETTVAADDSSKSSKSERYLDSEQLRKMVKKGLAETEGIREGDKWECQLDGGTYLIECLREGLCSMQWYGEVVSV